MTTSGSYIKVNSEEGGPYNASSNRVRFILREDNYDLDKSVLQLYVMLSTTIGEVGLDADSVYEIGLTGVDAFGVDRPELQNAAVVRHCSLMSSKLGNLEHIIRNDILRQNLPYYIKSTAELKAQAKGLLSSAPDKHEIFRSPLVRKYRYGSNKSYYVEVPIMIKLSDLFELGDLKWSAADLGECQIELELNTRYIRPSAEVERFPVDGVNELTQYEDYTAPAGQTVDLDTIVISAAFLPERLEGNPYYVGMPLYIQGSNNGVAFDVYRTITAISAPDPANNNRISLTFNSPIATVAATQTVAFTNPIEKVNPLTSELIFTKAEMITFKSDMQYVLQKPFTFRTFSTEQYRADGVNELRRMFDVEPNCDNMFVMFPDGGDLVSKNSHLDTYRIIVDGDDVNTRDVEFGVNVGVKNRDVLYFDNLSKALINSNDSNGNFRELKNLNELNYCLVNDREIVNRASANTQLVMIGTPLPLTPRQKLVQLNVKADGNNIDRVVLFKQITKQFK